MPESRYSRRGSAYLFKPMVNFNVMAEVGDARLYSRIQELGDASQTFGSGVRSKTGLVSRFQF
ncbi:hypothetical protein [Anabaena lutea]|uniref:Uncharacterized protein n=1 Tax=Anabaena lutea FACHB-196 TaxID=2692881 RepID=A0ABR8FBK1_9NOST|nr:hypothetical protein [Anabaena lutea]MBD2566948.1 hypothetical protein [Anabaena lutea FACHB-196]